jgi:signal transduction histidine kinase
VDTNSIAEATAAIQGLMELVTDLLEFGRVDSPNEAFHEVDLEAVFYQAYTMLRHQIKQGNAVVTHDPLPAVQGKEVQLRHLLHNLLSNALKYHGASRPRVHLGVQSAEDHCVFSVQDNGLGIAPEEREQIFDMFVRLHDPERIPGTGIGLALCRRIVEHHGGRIWVESVPGEGSTFYFTLPGCNP